MPLSEHEQRLFDSIGRELSLQDPKLAKKLGELKPYQPAYWRMRYASLSRPGKLFAWLAIILVACCFIWAVLRIMSPSEPGFTDPPKKPAATSTAKPNGQAGAQSGLVARGVNVAAE